MWTQQWPPCFLQSIIWLTRFTVKGDTVWQEQSIAPDGARCGQGSTVEGVTPITICTLSYNFSFKQIFWIRIFDWAEWQICLQCMDRLYENGWLENLSHPHWWRYQIVTLATNKGCCLSQYVSMSLYQEAPIQFFHDPNIKPSQNVSLKGARTHHSFPCACATHHSLCST